jgi:flavin-binding protein dodecin
MSVASISEISATSEKSFEDAIQQGIARATKTLRHVRSAWVKEQEVQVENDRITSYKVVLKVTFILEDTMGS